MASDIVVRMENTRDRAVRQIANHLAQAMLLAIEQAANRQPAPPQPTPTPTPRKHMLTADEVAEMLSVSVKTIYDWRSRPEPYGPPAIKVGRYLRWKPEIVQAWIDAQAPEWRG